MKKEALIGISVLLVMVSGSATVLNSFGVISGEASVEPAVQLTEIHYNPKSSSEDNEAIEVFNAGSQEIDISDWSVDYTAITNPKDVTDGEAIVESGEYAVITQDSDYTNENAEVFYVDSFGLNNGVETISLIYSDGESVIDSKEYDGECGDGESIQRAGGYDSDWECDAPTLGAKNKVSSSE